MEFETDQENGIPETADSRNNPNTSSKKSSLNFLLRSLMLKPVPNIRSKIKPHCLLMLSTNGRSVIIKTAIPRRRISNCIAKIKIIFFEISLRGINLSCHQVRIKSTKALSSRNWMIKLPFSTVKNRCFTPSMKRQPIFSKNSNPAGIKRR